MPTISMFYGILIQMFWADHAPPHFHVLYAEYEAQINIHTLEIIRADCRSALWLWSLNGRVNTDRNCWRIGNYAYRCKHRRRFLR